MARILTPGDGHWYDQLNAVAYYGETEFEKWIQQHAQSLFPHHYVFPFKKDIASKRTAEIRKPDLALIRKDFSEWVVVEVELEGHDLRHVMKQVRVFLDGDYNLLDITRYARDQLSVFCQKRLSLKKLKDFFNAHVPSVLVIANEHAEDWQKELRRLRVEYCIFEIYKSAAGPHVYRVFGEYPTMFADEAHCRPHPRLPNLLEVIGNFSFTQKGAGGLIDVVYEEYLTQWSFFAEGGKQYLRFVGKSNPLPLAPSNTYGLFRDMSNKYYFKRS